MQPTKLNYLSCMAGGGLVKQNCLLNSVKENAMSSLSPTRFQNPYCAQTPLSWLIMPYLIRAKLVRSTIPGMIFFWRWHTSHNRSILKWSSRAISLAVRQAYRLPPDLRAAVGDDYGGIVDCFPVFATGSFLTHFAHITYAHFGNHPIWVWQCTLMSTDARPVMLDFFSSGLWR